MKKLLTLILLATIFISCSKDDDDTVSTLENRIIGTWVKTTDDAIDWAEYLVFFKDGTYKAYYSKSDVTIDGKYSVSDNSIKMGGRTGIIENKILIIRTAGPIIEEVKYKRK